MVYVPMDPRPPTPNWFNKVNFIVGYWTQGCDLPLQVYIQFAQKPTNAAALMLITPDWKVLTRKLFRPKGLRSARHGRKGSRSGKKGGFIPDVDDIVFEEVFGEAISFGTPFGSETLLLFEIADEFLQVAWQFAVVDALTDIGYDTLLGIITCDKGYCPQIGRMFRFDNNQTILNTHGGFAQFPVSQLEWINHMSSPNGYEVGVVENSRYMATLAVRGEVLTPEPVDVTIGIGDLNAGRNLNESGTVRYQMGDEIDLQVDAQFTGPGDIGCTVNNTTVNHPGPGGTPIRFYSVKWLVLQLSADA